ncbi:hypothetical protein K431DRAFT_263728 [Polychaeton citri CBS 116435]|uniref:N-acetyltransferase domain-containing protein n=1 Tax=Polychaeton citri CBS 116435 TaxID=1314669 RepID=A0A9P4UPX4_9PEZI|nr:hypothetical protein K431DRAFT_263728 [Polychaeton citri CBS 116435]
MKDFEIRPAKSHEESKTIWWPFMQKLGWNRGWHDLETYMDHSQSCGLLLCVQKSTGKPVGHVSAVINSNSTGWVSMFIVDDAWQGKGIGREMFKAAMDEFKLHGTEVIGLDGVVVQKSTYERRGFKDSKLGVLKLMTRSLVAKQPTVEPTNALHDNGILIDLRDVPQHLLVEHELKHTGFERKGLWTDKNMFSRPDVLGYAVVTKKELTSVDDLIAWTLVRRCSGGCRVGPVYSNDPKSAKAVLSAAMDACTSQFLRRTPLPKEPMSDWDEHIIDDEASLVAEMWTGNPASAKMFEELGWGEAGVYYHRMWYEDKATPEQSEGGTAETGLFAVFDAAIG